MIEDVSRADYWENLYQTNEDGWDKGKVSPPIARMLRERFLSPGARICVVGAGPGHEAFEAAGLGFRVTAVDFAPSSMRQLREGAARTGTTLELLEADLFALPRSRAGGFDAVLEHTCFCAIDVGRREEYAEAMRQLLVPGGVFFGLFYAHKKEGGPPFSTTEAEVRSLFAPRFELERLVVPADSFENRRGNELEAVFRRK
jgi:methyl halide transferase